MKPHRRAMRTVLACAISLALGGCFWRGSSNQDCFRAQEYQAAASIDSVKIPSDLEAPAAEGRLAIPEVAAPAADAVGPGCLSEPPDYFGRPRD